MTGHRFRFPRPTLRLLAAAALGLLAASCAPPPRVPGALDVTTVAARFERQRVARETRELATRMEATLWVDGETTGRWPAVQLDIALAGPDGLRARAASLFGTAFDLVVRGDSLRAYVPPRRIGFESGALEESLGIRRPGAWACRTFAASWNPPDGRWSRPSGDSLWRSAWIEGADSLAMTLDGRALPLEVEVHSGGGRILIVRYRAWEWSEGVAWPSRIEFEQGAGAIRLACRVDRARFLADPDPQWMSLSIPASAERLNWSSLRDALGRIGSRP